MDISQEARARLRLAYVATAAAAPAPLVAVLVLNDPMTALVMGVLLVAAFALYHAADTRPRRIGAAAAGGSWIAMSAIALSSMPDPGPILRGALASAAAVTALTTFLLLGRRLRASVGKTA